MKRSETRTEKQRKIVWKERKVTSKSDSEKKWQ